MNQYGTLHQQGEFEVENHSVPQLGPHTQSDPPSASWQYMGPWSASPASFSHTRGQPLEDCPLIPRRPNVCGVGNHQLHILDNDKGKAPLVNEVELPPVVCGLPARPKSDSDSSLSSASEADIYFDGHGHVMPSPLRHCPSALLDSTQILFGPSDVLSAGPFFIDPIRRDPPNWVGGPVLTSAHFDSGRGPPGPFEAGPSNWAEHPPDPSILFSCLDPQVCAVASPIDCAAIPPEFIPSASPVDGGSPVGSLSASFPATPCSDSG